MPAALAATGIQPKPYHNLSSGAEDGTNVKHIINKSKEKNIFFYCLLFKKTIYIFAHFIYTIKN